MSMRCHRKKPSFGRPQRGQSMVETALFMTALITLIVGIFQAALTINTYLRVINAAREGGRYGMRTFDMSSSGLEATSAQNTVEKVEAAAAPLDLSADTAIILTAVKTTTAGFPTVTSYTTYYCYNTASCSTSVGSQGSAFDSTEFNSRYSQGNQTDGDDEAIIIEFYYRYPLFVWNANIPMYSYSIFRVIGQ